MKPRPILFCLVFALAYPMTAWANVAVYVFESDPDYPRTALSHGMVSFSLCMLSILGCAVASRSTGRKSFLWSVSATCAMVLLLGYFGASKFTWKSGDRPPDFRGSLRLGQAVPDSANQVISPPLVGVILAMVVFAAGWWLSRYFQNKQTPAAKQGEADAVAPALSNSQPSR